MSRDDVKGVHVFAGTRLIASLTTTATVPEPSYQIGEVSYEVISYLAVTEADGRRGFDLQVRAVDEPTS